MRSVCTTIVTLLALLTVNHSQAIHPDHQVAVSKVDKLRTYDESSRKTNVSWTSNSTIRVSTINTSSIRQYYQIRPPYILPVWRTAERNPVNIPPQPVHQNPEHPGYPIVNPPNRYPGLPYLPIDNTGTNQTNMETDNKYGEGFPVWDRVSSTTIKPTRRTRRPGQSGATHPPLLHKDVSTIVPKSSKKLAQLQLRSTRHPTFRTLRPKL